MHFSNWDELPGKKIWSWGVDADGKDWRKALSDNESAYVEVQGGLFRNQETYAFLQPQETVEFREYWLPVREIGGLSRANLHGAVHLTREGGKLTVGLNVTHANRECDGPNQGRRQGAVGGARQFDSIAHLHQAGPRSCARAARPASKWPTPPGRF